MTESDIKNTDDLQSQSKGEFLDAIRRHICQILGFDFGFIDIAKGHEINNVASFCFDDEADVAKEFVESLVDEHKQPITVANTLVAQKVKQTQRSWVGKAYSLEDVEKGLDEDSEGFPYMIVPVLSNPGARAHEVMGLIRVIAFDAAREITNQDLTTLKLMGEHLASRTGLFGDLADQVAAQKQTGDGGDLDNVLVIHSNRLVRRRFNRILGNGYRVIEGESSEKALELLDENRIDVILLDSDLQGASGFGFCKVLKETTKWKHIPVILVVTDDSASARVEGLNVGADDCIPDSCLDAELIARIRSSLRHRKSERELSVQLQLLEDYAQRLEKAHEQLSIDRQDTVQRNSQLEVLKREGEVQRHQDNLLHRISNVIRKSFNIRENLEEMLEALSGWFSLDCTFIVMPNDEEPEDTVRVECVSDKAYKVVAYDRDLDIFEIFKKNFQADQAIIANDAASDRRLDPFHKILKSGFSVQSLFFIPITYEQKLQGLLVGYKCEARAAWSRINETFMKAVVDQVAVGVVNARLYATVQRQATTDGLTGLYNHRTGQEKLADQLKQAERYQRRLSVIMLDVDHFKSINDSYGHPAGDTVLKSVARLIRNSCRDVDLPVRYGGEEFLLVLPEITQDGAMVVAERIRVALKSEVIKHEDIEINITASLGVASFPEDADSQQLLLDLADKSLYLSKRLGRDQVHTAGDLMFEPEPAAEEKSSADVAKSVRDGAFSPPVISEEARQTEELVPEVVDMVKSLAASLYAKSDYNKQHHLEVARMSELLAKVMGLSAQQVEQIRVAGLLHDVGVLQLPQELLNKEGNLTKEERDQVNQHATLGAQMLRPVRALKDICEILENHHERWDGTGYPKGLKGEDIPLPARIVAIVDSYHALISERPYRPAMTHDEALKILKDGAGRQWDPFLIEIFSAVMKSMRETTQEVQAKVALAATLAKAAAEHGAAAAQSNQDDKSKNGEGATASQPAPAAHHHDHGQGQHQDHSHDPALEHTQQPSEPRPHEVETSDQLPSLGQSTAMSTKPVTEEDLHDLTPATERSKISSIIGPLIKPIAPKSDAPNDERENSQTAEKVNSAPTPESSGPSLPEKTGFAVPAGPTQPTGPEQTGALASLVRPLPAGGASTAPPAVPQAQNQTAPSPQSSSLPPNQQSAPHNPPNSTTAQAQGMAQQPAVQQEAQPSIYGRPTQEPGQPAQRSPIIPPPESAPPGPAPVQPGVPMQETTPQKPMVMNPQGAGIQDRPASLQQGNLPAQGGPQAAPGPGQAQGAPLPVQPTQPGTDTSGYPRPYQAGQPVPPAQPMAPQAPAATGGPQGQSGMPPGGPGPNASHQSMPAMPPQGAPSRGPGVSQQGMPAMPPTGQPSQNPSASHQGLPGMPQAAAPVPSQNAQGMPMAAPPSPGPRASHQGMPGIPQGSPPTAGQTASHQGMPGLAPGTVPSGAPTMPPGPGFSNPLQQQANPAAATRPAAQPYSPPQGGQQYPQTQGVQPLNPQPAPAPQTPAVGSAPSAVPGQQPPAAGQVAQPYQPNPPQTVTGVQHFQGPQLPPGNPAQTLPGALAPSSPSAAPANQAAQPYSVPQQQAQPAPQVASIPNQQASSNPAVTPPATTGSASTPPQGTVSNPAAAATSAPPQEKKQPDTWDPYSYDDEDEIEGEL